MMHVQSDVLVAVVVEVCLSSLLSHTLQLVKEKVVIPLGLQHFVEISENMYHV